MTPRTLTTALVAVVLGACQIQPTDGIDEEAVQRLRGLQIPAEMAAGEDLYNARCSLCHGYLALGTRRGPPLVHRIYEPSHHADEAFHLAVSQGVRAHHWRFGDMPRIPGTTRQEVDEIIRYVRFLQREAGIE
jgi:mono/diheme cytochrome c family protein